MRPPCRDRSRTPTVTRVARPAALGSYGASRHGTADGLDPPGQWRRRVRFARSASPRSRTPRPGRRLVRLPGSPRSPRHARTSHRVATRRLLRDVPARPRRRRLPTARLGPLPRRDARQVGRIPERPARRAAVFALGLFGSFEVNAAVARGLKDDDPTVRGLAENALWAIWFRADSPENNATLEKVGRLIRQQRFEDAADLATGLIARAPRFAEAYNQRAIAEFFLGRFRERRGLPARPRAQPVSLRRPRRPGQVPAPARTSGPGRRDLEAGVEAQAVQSGPSRLDRGPRSGQSLERFSLARHDRRAGCAGRAWTPAGTTGVGIPRVCETHPVQASQADGVFHTPYESTRFQGCRSRRIVACSKRTGQPGGPDP